MLPLSPRIPFTPLRVIEVSIATLTILSVLPTDTSQHFFVTAAFALLVVHLGAVKWPIWQCALLYCASLANLYCLWFAPDVLASPSLLYQIFVIGSSAVSLLLLWLLPLLSHALHPRGPYKVGFRTLYAAQTPDQLVEEEKWYQSHFQATTAGDSKGGSFAHHPKHSFLPKRLHFHMRIYFPVAPDAPTRSAPYWHYGAASFKGFAKLARVPAFILAHLELLRVRFAESSQIATSFVVSSSSSPDTASSSRAKFPIILFSHGLGALPECYTSTILDLVSHGYVVVAPEHNDGSAALSKPRKKDPIRFFSLLRELRSLPPHHAAESEQDISEDARKNVHQNTAPLSAVQSGTNTDASKASAIARTDYEIRNLQLNQRARELRFALDVLKEEAARDESRLGSYLDWSRVVTMGHSFGGATATETAFVDGGSRVKGCVSLDGWQFPLSKSAEIGRRAALESGLPVPLLLIQSTTFKLWQENFLSMKNMFMNSHPDSVFLTLYKSGHQSFTDFSVFSPIVNVLTKAAGWHPERSLFVINDYMMAFLEREGLGLPQSSHLKAHKVSKGFHYLLDDASFRTQEMAFEERDAK